MRLEKWQTVDLGGGNLKLLNLDHPDIHTRVIAEIDSGIDVYYDERWKETEDFGRLLYSRQELVADKSVLVLGAGVGLETVVIGQLARTLYVNDLAPISIELCEEQLKANGIQNYTSLVGRFDTMPLPKVDLMVGCFVVYEKETQQAMSALLEETDTPLLLVNEELDAFRSLMKSTSRQVKRIGIEEGPNVVLLT